MLKITRLADYAVSIVLSFNGKEDEILSSRDIIKKTRLQKATVNKLLSLLVKKEFLEPYRGVNGVIKLKGIWLKFQLKNLLRQ